MNRHYRIVNPPPARRRRRGRGGAAAEEQRRPLRRSARPRDKRGRLVRAADRRHQYHAVWVADGNASRPARPLVGLHGRRRRAIEPLERRRTDGPTRCSTTSGRCPAASRTSSPSSCPSSSSDAVARRGRLPAAHDVLPEAAPALGAGDRGHERAGRLRRRPRPLPERRVARVLVSERPRLVAARGELRADARLADTRAVFFAFDARRRARCGASGSAKDLGVPLEIVEAPFRDLGDPLRGYLRELTADPDVAVVGRHARARLQRARTAPPQPARALHQAAAPLRAAGDPVERPVPPAMRILVGYDGSATGVARWSTQPSSRAVGAGGDRQRRAGAVGQRTVRDDLREGARPPAEAAARREARSEGTRPAHRRTRGRGGSGVRDPVGRCVARRAAARDRDRRPAPHAAPALARRIVRRACCDVLVVPS